MSEFLNFLSSHPETEHPDFPSDATTYIIAYNIGNGRKQQFTTPSFPGFYTIMIHIPVLFLLQVLM
tara:strand:- start:387 stop:584 length:198 start_codon:yes stop_codon:yes gene_type:complete